MNVFLMILILNVIFIVSFLVFKNILISFLSAAFSFFILLLFLKQTKENNESYLNLKLLSPNFKSNQYTSCIVCLILFIFLEKFIGFQASLFVTFFIFLYVNKLDGRLSFLISLFLLFITALLTAGKNTIAAESVAISAYYFLTIGVCWQMFKFWTTKTDIV